MQKDIINNFRKTVLSGEFDLENQAIAIFQFQYEHNQIYRKYVNSLGLDPKRIQSIKEIPFLPIELYKFHAIKTTEFTAEKIYKSSGTSDIGRSRHYMADNNFYLHNALNIFESYYGSIAQYIIVAILPSYQEQGDSSLISMTDYFIKQTNHEKSGYYRGKQDELSHLVELANQEGRKLLILGVTYALLEIAHSEPDLNGHIVMETGGMKGRGKELVRAELHDILCSSFNLPAIHSEYGMTELTSQAYSEKDGIFKLPSTMKALIRDINDPFHYVSNDKTGGINIIDLANITTCSFIETKDLGRAENSEQLEILGRFDNSDLRGCNLLLV